VLYDAGGLNGANLLMRVSPLTVMAKALVLLSLKRLSCKHSRLVPLIADRGDVGGVKALV